MGFSLHYGISPMPSSSKARGAIFSLIPTTEGKIYELGSGWGHLIFPLARKYTSLQIEAIEGSPLPWLISKGAHKLLQLPNLTIDRKNFFTVSLEEADGVVCYLYPGAMKRLREKFEKEMKSGAFVITNTFAIPKWTPEKVIQINDLWRSSIYLYRVPAKSGDGQSSQKP